MLINCHQLSGWFLRDRQKQCTCDISKVNGLKLYKWRCIRPNIGFVIVSIVLLLLVSLYLQSAGDSEDVALWRFFLGFYLFACKRGC